MTARIAVGVSGAGSNLRALHAAAERRELGGDIVLVFADRACAALDWAAEHGVDTALVAGGDDEALAEALAGARPDVVVLAGYMRIVGPKVLEAYAGRIINTHPSLLPAFPGATAVRDAIEHGVRVTGVTVHIVDETLDGRSWPRSPCPCCPMMMTRACGHGSRRSSTGCCRGPWSFSRSVPYRSSRMGVT
jgi:phosphoribosylglycinamide formyltransferase-1